MEPPPTQVKTAHARTYTDIQFKLPSCFASKSEQQNGNFDPELLSCAVEVLLHLAVDEQSLFIIDDLPIPCLLKDFSVLMFTVH